MPKLANERHELYARHRAKGMLPSKAATTAGFATGSAIYSKLEGDPEVLARVAELMEEFDMKREAQRSAARESGKVVGQMTGVGKAWVIAQLAENAQLARMDGDFKESNIALTKIGEHFGMWKGDGKDPDDRGAEDTTSHINIDELNALTDGTQNAIESAEFIQSKKINADLTERAMRLIGTNAKKSIGNLTNGSEADVAFTELEIEEDDEDEDPVS